MKTPATLTGLFVATAISLASTAAFAQQSPNTPVQSRLDLFGVAPAACVLNGPSSSNSVNATVNDAGSRTTQVTITNLVDTNSLAAQAATVNLAFPLICNGPHKLTLTTTNGGLTLEGGAPSAPGFTDHVDYVMQAAWAGQTSQVSTGSARSLQISAGDGAAGVVSLSIQIPGGGNRLIAGSYSDTLTLDVQPAT
ncbi:MAG TPA: hypothetical protein VG407_18860 [Caulobacteraceae bacterium]|jgi:hypothetical protein|nr:hypothetical protein [Caulobacteraceae bacterium]